MSIHLPQHIAPLLLQAAQPAVLSADLDRDGVVEQVSVSFSPMQEILVTVAEPDGTQSVLNLGAFQDGSGVQKDAVISLPALDQTGVPLVRVQAESAELCATWEHDIFISYTEGTPLVAFEAVNSPALGAEITFLPEQLALLHTITSDGDRTEVRHVFDGGVFVPAQ